MKKKKKEPEFIEPERSYVAVFGYGSLVAPYELDKRTTNGRPKPFYAYLNGFSRNWMVTAPWGMGEFFLGIDFHAGQSVNGAVIFVDEYGLEGLDQREALYHRQRVDGMVFTREEGNGVAVNKFYSGPVYTYIPNTFAVKRANERLKEGSAYISNRYHTIVSQAFKAADQLAEFRESTPIPDGMIVRPELKRERWIEGRDGFVRPFNNSNFHMASAFVGSGPTEA